MEDNTVVKTNFQKIKNANSVEEVATMLTDVLVTNIVTLEDTEGTILFQNGRTKMLLDWNDGNKAFAYKSILGWLNAEENKIPPIEANTEEEKQNG